MNERMRVLNKKNGAFLIFICCLTYSTAYVGRLGYGANLDIIKTAFGASNDAVGIVSSFYFFSYALGQLLNSVLSKYYNPKYVVTAAMIVSALSNLGIGLLPELGAMKYVWLINGIAQSMLWCNLLNVQSKYLSSKHISLCIICMSVTYGIGTLVCYGLSALMAFLGISWRVTFCTIAGLVFVVGMTYFFSLRHIEHEFHGKGAEFEEVPVPAASAPAEGEQKKFRLYTGVFCSVLVFAAFGAFGAAFIRDGVVNWLPTILREDFGVEASLSIILTMILPLLSILGAFLVKALKKRVRGNLFLESAFFLVATLSLLGIVFSYPARSIAVTVAFFALMYLAICSIVNLTTSIIPFSVRQYGNVGSLSALLDACCYAGSVCSTYGLGVIAEQSFDWAGVIRLIAIFAGVAVAVTFIGSLLARRNEMNRNIF